VDIFEPPDRKGRAYVTQDQARMEQAQDILRRSLSVPKLDLVRKASGAQAVAVYDSTGKLIGTAPPEKINPVAARDALYNAAGALVGVQQADGSTLRVGTAKAPVAKARQVRVRKVAASTMTAQQLFQKLRAMKGASVKKSANTLTERRRLTLWGSGEYLKMSAIERARFDQLAQAARARSAKRRVRKTVILTPESLAAGEQRLAKTRAMIRGRRG